MNAAKLIETRCREANSMQSHRERLVYAVRAVDDPAVLKLTERALLMAIVARCVHFDETVAETGRAVQMAEIAGDLGMNAKTASQYLARLIGAGYVAVKKCAKGQMFWVDVGRILSQPTLFDGAATKAARRRRPATVVPIPGRRVVPKSGPHEASVLPAEEHAKETTAPAARSISSSRAGGDLVVRAAPDDDALAATVVTKPLDLPATDAHESTVSTEDIAPAAERVRSRHPDVARSHERGTDVAVAEFKARGPLHEAFARLRAATDGVYRPTAKDAAEVDLGVRALQDAGVPAHRWEAYPVYVAERLEVATRGRCRRLQACQLKSATWVGAFDSTLPARRPDPKAVAELIEGRFGRRRLMISCVRDIAEAIWAGGEPQAVLDGYGDFEVHPDAAGRHEEAGAWLAGQLDAIPFVEVDE